MSITWDIKISSRPFIGKAVTTIAAINWILPAVGYVPDVYAIKISITNWPSQNIMPQDIELQLFALEADKIRQGFIEKNFDFCL
ncbi:MAG: hypothetical protein NTY37_06945 [Methanothrix sp.]|nr:hypothetical protein [Methanothrix sp.]